MSEVEEKMKGKHFIFFMSFLNHVLVYLMSWSYIHLTVVDKENFRKTAF